MQGCTRNGTERTSIDFLERNGYMWNGRDSHKERNGLERNGSFWGNGTNTLFRTDWKAQALLGRHACRLRTARVPSGLHMCHTCCPASTCAVQTAYATSNQHMRRPGSSYFLEWNGMDLCGTMCSWNGAEQMYLMARNGTSLPMVYNNNPAR